MSRYEWEHGVIKIPAKEWSSFRKSLIRAWNEDQEKVYKRALVAWDKVSQEIKGKRGENRVRALNAALDRYCDVETWSLISSYQQDSTGRYMRKVHKPKKPKAFPLTKDAVLNMPDATIVLKNETKTVEWDVPENNHACDSARMHPIATVLFRLLSQMTWTRGSGGQIVGNDEYNRDSYEGGGGANYVKKEYPPQSAGKPGPARLAARFRF